MFGSFHSVTQKKEKLIRYSRKERGDQTDFAQVITPKGI